MSNEDPTKAPDPSNEKNNAEESDSDECPQLEPISPPTTASPQDIDQSRRISRREKKSMKALSKLGLKPFPGVRKVTIRRGRGIQFVIQSPEVFKSPASDTYVICGEAKLEDFTVDAQRQLVERIAAASAAMNAPQPAPPASTATDSAAGAQAESADTTGDVSFSQEDIEVVMSSSRKDRATAIEALRKADGDIVKAIMSLTD